MNGKLLIGRSHIGFKSIDSVAGTGESTAGTSNPDQIISYINKEEYDVILIGQELFSWCKYR